MKKILMTFFIFLVFPCFIVLAQTDDSTCMISLSDTDPNFIPEARHNGQANDAPYDGNTLTYTGYVVKGPARRLIFSLGSSKEPGFALNAGSPEEYDYSKPDYYIDEKLNPDLDVMPGGQLATTKTKVTKASVILTSRDFGGWGSISLRACGCGEVLKFYPVDDNRNRIADAAQLHNPFSALYDSDYDARGRSGNNGDGLSAYEEYRGFFVQGQHIRTDPTRIDVAIYRQNKRYDTGWVDIHVNVLDVTPDEINGIHCSSKDPGSVNKGVGVRVLNFNHGLAHLVNQHGLWLQVLESTYSVYGKDILGFANGDNCTASKIGPGPPYTAGNIQVFVQALTELAQKKTGKKFTSNGEPILEKMIKYTITHELFHRMSVQHHPDESVDLKGHAGNEYNIPYIMGGGFRL